jgi:glycosyltransferase involved in cell wall biosynthesis
MKILLVGNYDIDRQVSMQRFSEMLERGLVARGHAVRFLMPTAVLFSRVDRKEGFWKWVGYVNKFILFPRVLRRAAQDADVVHICDHSNAMYVRWIRDRPHVVTCHDVIAIRAARGLEPGWAVGSTGRLFQRLILAGLSRAQVIACVSKLTVEQLLALDGRCRSRVRLVQNGLNYPFAPSTASAIVAVRARFGIAGGRYLLHVGSSLPRKNRAHIVRVLAAMLAREPTLDLRLVFVGAPAADDVAKVAAEFGLGARVVGIEDVENEALCALYTGATALIFPSLSEGFGWPVIEAQACGCPVFLSSRRPMTDIGGDAAIAIDPLNAEVAAEVILAHLPVLADRRSPSLKNASLFSAAAMIEGYERLYREVVRGSQDPQRLNSEQSSDA